MNQYSMTRDEGEARELANDFVTTFNRLRTEVSKFIVGHEDIIEKSIIAIICGGHVLLEGVPGLGKTALVTTISQVLDLKFGRVQFTPDLLPADLVGTNILVEKNGQKVFQFQPGPLFVNVLLADEINRATPKTQSALLEAMQEKTVTVARTKHELKLPFFVLATQNPIEMDGTYPLPEAQLDRFFFKLKVEMATHNEFSEILDRTCGVELPQLKTIADGQSILRMGEISRQVPIEASVQDYLIRVVRATHPEDIHATDNVKRFVRYGASPRAAQAVLSAARVKALLQGRYHVAHEDVDDMAVSAMCHRIILSFEGEAEGIAQDQIIREIVEKVQ